MIDLSKKHTSKTSASNSKRLKKSASLKTRDKRIAKADKAKAKKDKIAKKRDDHTHIQFLCEKTPYSFTPSFFYHNGKVGTIVQLYVRSGTNRQMMCRDIIDLIPRNPLDNVDMYMLIDDSLVKYDTKKRLIRMNAGDNKATIKDQSQTGDKRHEVEDESVRHMWQSDMEDYNTYESILDSAEPVVVFKMTLIITGDTQALVDEQLQIINTILDQNHEGACWDSLGGDQFKRFTDLFKEIDHTRFNMTSTGSNYAGLNFAVNSGLRDKEGVPIGVDALSLSNPTAFFDFDRSTSRLGLIAMPANAVMNDYKRDDNRQVPVSSIMAQCAANHIAMKGHAVKHFVLNQFDYFEQNLYYRPRETESIFKQYDVSTMTINPLQGFGEITDVVQVFSRLTQKIVNIFDLLEDLQLTQDQKAIILTVIERFYMNQQLWTIDAEMYPKRTHIVNITKPETYPTMGMLLHEFTSIAQFATRSNRELKADKIDTLQHLLSQSLTAHMGVLGRPTSIEDASALQTYYDFKSIESMSMQQVQFINMLDYVIWTCKQGDAVVIHGADMLYDTTLKMVTETVKSAENKGIRFIFAYDTLIAQDSLVDKMSDMFKLKGSFYTDLDSDVDWSITGKMLVNELNAYESALNTTLSDIIRENAAAKFPCQALVHRHQDSVNNFVHLRVLI